MLKKTLIYLGLGPDEEYDSFDDYAPGAPVGESAERAPAAAAAPTVRSVPSGAALGSPRPTVRPVQARPEASGNVRVVPAEPGAAPSPAPKPAASPAPRSDSGPVSAIRIVDTPNATPHVIAPAAFNDAQSIGDRFKSGQPVIVNLQDVDRDLRRRLVDFASGLCFGLGGKMDRVAGQVYLLTPAGVVVSESEARQALH